MMRTRHVGRPVGWSQKDAFLVSTRDKIVHVGLITPTSVISTIGNNATTVGDITYAWQTDIHMVRSNIL